MQNKPGRFQCLLVALAFAGAGLLHPLAAQEASYPYTIKGKVVGITDGDTIKVLRDKTLYKVRLNGIDAPEPKQAFGSKAKEFLASLVFEQAVEVIIRDIDRYGRYVGDVLVGRQSANEALVAAGLAWHYVAYSKDKTLAALEKAARAKGLGLWSDSAALPPWELRRVKKLKS